MGNDRVRRRLAAVSGLAVVACTLAPASPGAEVAAAAEPQAAPGQISGTVWSSTGTPLAGVEVRVGDHWGISGPDGRYTVAQLPPGDHRVVFYGNEIGHESVRLDGTPYSPYEVAFDDFYSNSDSDINIGIDPGEAVVGINAVLRPDGSLSGTVDGVTDVAEIRHLRVDVYQLIEPYDGWQRVAVKRVADSGEYVFQELPPGDYRLVLRELAENRLDDRAVLGHSGGAASFASSSPVLVGPGEDVTGVRLVVERSSSLNGTFTSEVGGPMGEAPVRLQKWDGAEETWHVVARTVTSSTGGYAFGALTAGRYRLGYDMAGREHQLVQPADFLLTRGAAEQVDVVLRRPGRVVGRITDAATGQPVEGVHVSPYRQLYGSTWSPTYHGTTTDAAGRYSLDFTGGARIRLGFRSADHAAEFNGDADTVDHAPTIDVPATGDTVEDVVLSAGGSVSGTVTDRATDAPVSGYSVSPLRLVDGAWVSAGDQAFDDPTYRIDRLVPGTYVLRYASPTQVVTYSGGVSALSAATRLEVVDGEETVRDQDIAMSGQTVSGSVSFARTDPSTGEDEIVAGPMVTPSLYEWIAGQWHHVMSGQTTEEDGTYEMRRVPPGTYRVGYEDVWRQYASEFWDDTQTVEAAQDIVVTRDLPVTEVDATLVSDPQRRILSDGGTVEVSGHREVGEPLTVSRGSWNRPDLTFTYRWLADGEPIPGADQAVFVPTPDLVGKRLYARVTAHGPGSPPALAGTDTGPIGQALAPGYTAQVAPSVLGTPMVGRSLEATAGSWSPSGGTHAYQWLSGSSPLAGASRPTYVPTANDVGAQIRVRVLTWGRGVIPAVTTSEPTAPVAPQPPPRAGETDTPVDGPRAQVSNRSRPTIRGHLRVGSRLRARPGRWTPDDVTFRFRWYADGRRIRGATDRHLRLTPAMRGARLVVRVTARASGDKPVTAQSSRTRAVRPRRT